MDKNAIKKFAVWARTELIARVSLKGVEYGITEDNIVDAAADSINGKVLTNIEKKQRMACIAEINDKGYKQVMEEVAYTWFNRFSALRFMEVNGYLPSHVRVFTDEENNFKPQIITEAIHLDLDGLDMEKVYELKEAEKTEELYKYLLIVQCNALNKILPGMFQKISDYTELLLPDNLLRDGSVIQQMIELIPEEDWKDAVQIIGWLYQYYNSEKKDDVFAALKKNVKITKENIPAATQLFTPDWIVRYMVENSLGRLWLEGHPDAKEQLLPTEEEQSAYVAGNRNPEDTKWHYYLEEAEQEPEVQAQLVEIRKEYAALTPEQLKVIDPCSGSGHILAYMFDVLMKIYESYGYTTREAVASIMENNIYGLDIDDRAAQLAYFAVMMKARQYDRRFFSRGIQPHVYAIVESNHVDKFAVEYFCNGDAKLKEAMDTIISELYDAKEYGSILTITQQDWAALYDRFAEITEDIHMSRDVALEELLPLVQVAEALSQKYDAVVTNPPYMGASNMNLKLNEFIKNNYADYKSDFFSAFVIHASQMTKQNGYCGFFTPYVWMFIQSYEKMRNYLYNQATMETLIQFEYSAFEEATVPVCTFAFQNRHIVRKKGCYLRLVDFRGGMEVQRQKTLEALGNHNCGFYYEQSTDNFLKIPGSPVAYWASSKLFDTFASFDTIGDYYDVRNGITTGDNNTFLKLWYEVDKHTERWFSCNKGGTYRKWYGNKEYVVDWENDGERLKTNVDKNGKIRATLRGIDFNFTEGITMSRVTSGLPSFREMNSDSISESATNAIYPKSRNRKDSMKLLALLNSKIGSYVLPLLNPTINVVPEDIRSIPIKMEFLASASDYTEINCVLAKEDWDAFETSWDFQHHPLLRKVLTIAEAFDQWQAECDDRFNQLKANEEELNRIFIDIYGLQDELTPDVEDKDVTVRKAELARDIRSFISYAVGCMLGRYSLDADGIAYAGGEWDASKYASFPADKDNIIPICDDEYFEDDIVGLFVEFVKTVYGAEILDENLKFIADALGGKGQPKDVIRNYFLNDFYADHCKIYQKRPIYWLFDSGKKNGFKALIYMHRYQPDTIARIRTDYVHEQQARYRTAIADLEQRIANASTGERVKLNKKLTALQAQDTEIRTYEEKIHHLADQMISIDLDDGVKKNYVIFQDVLAKIK
ncbi:BREX-1 system adenine-specific DNA-methyltransferase PglX [Clostridiaceae bacterium]|nr:BREX-1 system adenine-specific DNA-methyltransferase PglX [Clostridiaceae bacterium]